MGKLKIQVNGHGMIPRGYGIAPRKEPFPVTDMYFINLILNTPGLSVKFINPENGKLEEINKKNLKKIWDTYSNYIPDSQKPLEQTSTTSKISNETISINSVNNQQKSPVDQNDLIDNDQSNSHNNEGKMMENISSGDDVPSTSYQNNNKNGKNNKKHY